MQDTLHKDFNRNKRDLDLLLNCVHASLVFHAEITPGAHIAPKMMQIQACVGLIGGYTASLAVFKRVFAKVFSFNVLLI